MRLQNKVSSASIRAITLSAVTLVAMTIAQAKAFAQSKQYQRKKPAAPAPVAAPAGAPANAQASGAPVPAPAGDKSDKLDISELEQKYWAPKDTDFSVVQNRTYTKANRYAVSLLTGPAVNDPFNSGFSYAAQLNYYLNERYGVEFQYVKADLTDSDSTKKFKKQLSGGSVPPDFNRPLEFYGVGFNWVPFYAKMSVLGSKIIYFDMQITPIIGMSKYEQQTQVAKNREQSAFTYGIDVTQYFFVHKNLAYRFNFQNRWSQQDVLGYQTGIKKRDDNDNTSLFLFGLTYFH